MVPPVRVIFGVPGDATLALLDHVVAHDRIARPVVPRMDVPELATLTRSLG